jgi:hypothetical protein
MSEDFYVYFHINDETGKVFYVGKGRANRAHSKQGRSIYWKNYTNKYKYHVDIIDQNLTESEAYRLEIEYIKNIGLSNLVNMTEGGTGGDTISKHPDRNLIVEKQKNYANSNRDLLAQRAKEAWTDEFRGNQIEKQSKKPLLALDLDTGMTIFANNSKEMAKLLKTSHSGVRTAKGSGWRVLKRYLIVDDFKFQKIQ